MAELWCQNNNSNGEFVTVSSSHPHSKTVHDILRLRRSRAAPLNANYSAEVIKISSFVIVRRLIYYFRPLSPLVFAVRSSV